MSLDIKLPSIDHYIPQYQYPSNSIHSNTNPSTRSTVEQPSSQTQPEPQQSRINRFFKRPRRKDKYQFVDRSNRPQASQAPQGTNQHTAKNQPQNPKQQEPTTRTSETMVRMVNFRNINIPHPRVMRENFQPEAGTSGALLLSWALSSFLAIIIPVSKWAAERNRYHNYYGKYNEYNQQQQQYENNQNGNYNGNGNGNYNGGYGSLCSWYNFSCRYKVYRYQQMYGNGNNNGDGGNNDENAQMSAMMPGWYFFFGGSVEDDEREREEMGMGQNEGSMKFVYFMTIVMFVGLSIFGFKAMYDGKDRMGVIVALLIFGQFSLMNLLTTVQGTIETDNRYFEDSVYGWFGQWSVLVAYTDFWLMLYCFVFAGFLGLTRCLDKKAQRDVAAVEAEEAEEMGYHKEDDDVINAMREGFDA